MAQACTCMQALAKLSLFVVTTILANLSVFTTLGTRHSERFSAAVGPTKPSSTILPFIQGRRMPFRRVNTVIVWPHAPGRNRQDDTRVILRMARTISSYGKPPVIYTSTLLPDELGSIKAQRNHTISFPIVSEEIDTYWPFLPS